MVIDFEGLKKARLDGFFICKMIVGGNVEMNLLYFLFCIEISDSIVKVFRELSLKSSCIF